MWNLVTDLWLEFVRTVNVMMFGGLWLLWMWMLADFMVGMLKANGPDLRKVTAYAVAIFTTGLAIWFLFPHYPSPALLRTSFIN